MSEETKGLGRDSRVLELNAREHGACAIIVWSSLKSCYWRKPKTGGGDMGFYPGWETQDVPWPSAGGCEDRVSRARSQDSDSVLWSEPRGSLGLAWQAECPIAPGRKPRDSVGKLSGQAGKILGACPRMAP